MGIELKMCELDIWKTDTRKLRETATMLSKIIKLCREENQVCNGDWGGQFGVWEEQLLAIHAQMVAGANVRELNNN